MRFFLFASPLKKHDQASHIRLLNKAEESQDQIDPVLFLDNDKY